MACRNHYRAPDDGQVQKFIFWNKKMINHILRFISWLPNARFYYLCNEENYHYFLITAKLTIISCKILLSETQLSSRNMAVKHCCVFIYNHGISYFTIGICYDHVNNQIWTSSEDCIEEWLNIGALSYHHIVQKLSPRSRGVFFIYACTSMFIFVVKELVNYVPFECRNKA